MWTYKCQCLPKYDRTHIYAYVLTHCVRACVRICVSVCACILISVGVKVRCVSSFA